jgi:predicted ArsR family transcriptional regulator
MRYPDKRKSRELTERKIRVLIAVAKRPASNLTTISKAIGLATADTTVKRGLFDLKAWGLVTSQFSKQQELWYATAKGKVLIDERLRDYLSKL